MRCKRIITMIIGLLLPMSLAVSAQEGDFAVLRAQTVPVLDGCLAANEWGAPLYSLQPSDGHAYVQRSDETAELPADMQVYMMWDEQYLYVAAAVRRAEHINTQTEPANGWDGHALMLTLQAGKGQDRLSLALGADGAVLCGDHARGNKEDRDQASTAHTGAVTHKDGVTVYEMRVQWSELVYHRAPKADEEITFSVAAHLADAERKSYAGTFLYAAAQGDQLTLPVARFDSEAANADFDPNATTTTTTQTKITQSTTTAAPSRAGFWPTAPMAKWMLIGCLGGAVLLLVILLVVVVHRRK